MGTETVLKRYLPRTLLGRSLLIIVTPLVLLQVVSAFIFYETHWAKVSLRMARSLAGNVATIATLLRDAPPPAQRARIFKLAADHMGIVATLRPEEILPNKGPVAADGLEATLIRALRDHLNRPFRIDTRSLERHVMVEVQLADGVLETVFSRKLLFSSTVHVFVLWMVGTALILLGVATVFMRNQVKPIRRLALAAENFGKGRDVARFKPEGAVEVRQAASAFLAMRERLLHQRRHRTEMLAGVSHDLRTPLTRMKLQLALLGGGEGEGYRELATDIAEMERMLDGYLAFARGEGAEKAEPTDLGALLDEAVSQARRKGASIEFEAPAEGMVLQLRPNAFRRCLTNLIDNAERYAEHVWIVAAQPDDRIEVLIDDDGPGIPLDRREDAFKAFYRLEGSRNPETGGVGLGLAIARDVVRGHGGDIELEDSPRGGLRVRLAIPL